MRLCLPLLACLIAWVLPASALAVETGINIQDLPAAESVDKADQMGAVWIRRFVSWSEIEPSQGQWNDAPVREVESLASLAKLRGHKVNLIFTGAPPWANGSSNHLVAPQDPQLYAQFLGRMASRLKGKVDAWEIWNEPDAVEFWPGPPEPSPQAYLSLLRPAYAAIKSEDPSSLVLAGPLTGNNYQFVEGLYQQGGKPFFDGVSTHTDTACNLKSPDQYYRDERGRVGQYNFLSFREVREVMVENGDSGKPILMTELGWSTATGLCARTKKAGLKNAGVSEAQQAANLSLAYRCMANYPYMLAGMWFNYRDISNQDVELSRYGLVRHDFSPKPAFLAMQEASASIVPEPNCGDFDGPVLKVLSPLEGVEFNHALELSASASDPNSPLRRIRFSVGDKGVGNFMNPANGQVVGRRWIGARNLPVGPVSLQVEAKDQLGNSDRQLIEAEKVDTKSLPRSKPDLKVTVSGSGRTRSFRGAAYLPGTQVTPTGKVLFKLQLKRGGKFRTAYKRMKNIPYGFELRRKLRPGVWRVDAAYAGERPFLPTRFRSAAFRVG